MALFGKKKTEDAKDDNLTSDKKKVDDVNKKVNSKKKTDKTSAPKTKEVKSEKTQENKEAESMKDLYEGGKVSKKGAKQEVKKTSSFNYTSTIVKPLVTEKATTLSSESKYVFVVNNKANKIEVKKAVESIYGVKPLDVNIIRMKGKAVSRGRIRGKRKDWKKAVVTLPKGKTIAIYEGV